LFFHNTSNTYTHHFTKNKRGAVIRPKDVRGASVQAHTLKALKAKNEAPFLKRWKYRPADCVAPYGVHLPPPSHSANAVEIAAADARHDRAAAAASSAASASKGSRKGQVHAKGLAKEPTHGEVGVTDEAKAAPKSVKGGATSGAASDKVPGTVSGEAKSATRTTGGVAKTGAGSADAASNKSVSGSGAKSHKAHGKLGAKSSHAASDALECPLGDDDAMGCGGGGASFLSITPVPVLEPPAPSQHNSRGNAAVRAL